MGNMEKKDNIMKGDWLHYRIFKIKNTQKFERQIR